MTQEVVTAVETAAEVAAPVVTGAPDWKKVALYAGATVAVAGGAYLTYRLIKKRKVKKTEVVLVNPENEVIAATEVVIDETPDKK